MRVLLAPEAFAGTLTAAQAAEALAGGWSRHAPGDCLVRLPLSDAGAGLVETLRATLGGELLTVTATGPQGATVPATLLLTYSRAGGRTVWLEADQVVGRHLVAEPAAATGTATSTGIGELLLHAAALRPQRVVVGLGEAAGCDGGAGLLAALGAGPAGVLGAGALALADTTPDDLAGLPAARDALAGVDLLVAGADDGPLLGFSGAAAGLATRRITDAAAAQRLESALGHFAHLAEATLPSLPGPPSRRPSAAAGAGAAGGAGFALALLGGRREPGPQVVADAVDLAGQVRAADLVVTGEGRLGWRSLRGSVLVTVARAALAAGVPCISVCGQVEAGRRELLGLGVEAAYAVAERPEQVAPAMADPAGLLASRAARVARTWSR